MEVLDSDGDGYSTCDGDCDDGDATLNLSDKDNDGYSTCDGDCDDSDETLELIDADGDGFSVEDGDCDDGGAGAETFRVQEDRAVHDDLAGQEIEEEKPEQPLDPLRERRLGGGLTQGQGVGHTPNTCVK